MNKKLLLFFFIGSLVQILYSLGKIVFRGIFLTDFVRVYWASGQAILEGINPYKLVYPPAYPPPALLLFLALSRFNFIFIQVAWLLLSFLILLPTAVFSLKSLGLKIKKESLFLTLGLIFIAFPTKFSLGSGQINTLIAFFMTLFFFYLSKKNDIKSALFLSLGLLWKITPVFALAYLVLKKRWKILGFTLGLVFIGYLISFVFLGKEIVFDYLLRVGPNMLHNIGNTSYYNQALTGFFNRSVKIEMPARQALIIIFSLGLLILTFRKIWVSKNEALNFSLIVISNVLLNGLSWQHHLVFLIFPMIVIGQQLIMEKKGKGWWFLFILSYVLVSLNIPNYFPFYNNFWLSLLLSHATYGLMILWFLALGLSQR